MAFPSAGVWIVDQHSWMRDAGRDAAARKDVRKLHSFGNRGKERQASPVNLPWHMSGDR